MLSVLFMGSYKRPRELTWVSGFILFNLALVFCLTGYLLPWSQLSFWATTVATDAAGAIPIVGDQLVAFMRGGPTVNEATLGRFFALHVMGLPLVFFALVGFHLFCVRRVGISKPPFGDEYRTTEMPLSFHHEEHQDGVPFHPNYTIKDTRHGLFCPGPAGRPSPFLPPGSLSRLTHWSLPTRFSLRPTSSRNGISLGLSGAENIPQ
jgi:ubiquinol-cytochrome c reductase cytochrome b subunit